ncbi:NEAT domain-containing protein [Staphylococcus caprae]|uniref:NEAT domain-containing protein n=1 Tax=Staphylococcus caprae TaxID=29380 RepID=UPI001F5A9948|nr:NEAT domain-containing protein [Staphylococcus caprae]MCI2955753.1 NEAT domain-containing protein [Staphylococcus caprae]
MNKHQKNHTLRYANYFSIRKLTVGVASITLGTALFLSSSHDAQAAENSSIQSDTKTTTTTGQNSDGTSPTGTATTTGTSNHKNQADSSQNQNNIQPSTTPTNNSSSQTTTKPNSQSDKKITAKDYQATTYKNLYDDVVYDKNKLHKELPLFVSGHFRNAMNNEETSLYEGALNPNVKIEKVNDLYKYTVRLHPGIADVGGEFYDFDLFKMEYKDQPLELRTINEKNRIKEFSVTSKDLLEKIQLTGTTKYPENVNNPSKGRDQAHDVTLQLYYDSARKFNDALWNDPKEVPSKPAKPAKTASSTTQTKLANQTTTLTQSSVEDHEVEANKVPNAYPVTIQGELKYQKDNSQTSTYANLFEKDVKVEKDGDKYKYTFKVKEANGNTLITKRTKYQFSKITHNGENVLLTEQADKVKEAVLTTDKLLDKIQLKTTVVSKYDKAGNEVDTTLDLDFPIVEKPQTDTTNNATTNTTEVTPVKTEFENATPTPTVLKDEKAVDFSVLKSLKDQPSVMENYIQKPFKVAVDEKGNQLVVLTLNNDSYWKEFKVEGTRVTTIAKDKEHDTRTITFPYVEGKKVYQAFVSVEVPKIGYKGNYKIRIVNNNPKKEPEKVPERIPNKEPETPHMKDPNKTPTTPTHKKETIKITKKDETKVKGKKTTNDDTSITKDKKHETKHQSDKSKTLPNTGADTTTPTIWASVLSFFAGVLLLKCQTRKSNKKH